MKKYFLWQNTSIHRNFLFRWKLFLQMGKTVIPGYVDQHVHVIGGGSDADLVILDEEFLVDTVFVRGQKMVEYGKALVKGTFETD